MLNLFEGQVKEDRGVGILPAWVAGREEAADVARRHGSQQGVGNGVQQHIAIGVTGQAFRVFERHAADAQRYAWFESVRVPAKANA
jgi:hypothetical protein